MELGKGKDVVATKVDERRAVVTTGVGEWIIEAERQFKNQEHFKKEKYPTEMNLKLMNDTIRRFMT